MEMMFFLPMQVPTRTFQSKKVTAYKGKARLYTPPELVEIQQKFISALSKYAPEKPMDGPVALTTIFLFPSDKKHPPRTPKTTKPDTDNLVKMLKDCMTKCGFWNDDAQVSKDIIVKRYDIHEGIFIAIEPDGV